jgi:hypothetical protein
MLCVVCGTVCIVWYCVYCVVLCGTLYTCGTACSGCTLYTVYTVYTAVHCVLPAFTNTHLLFICQLYPTLPTNTHFLTYLRSPSFSSVLLHSPQHSPPSFSPIVSRFQWQLLFTGGHEVQCYDIEWDKVLVTMQKGWDAQEVLDFLLKQDVVVEVSESKRSKRSKRSKECLCIKNYHCVLCCAVCVCVCVCCVLCAVCGQEPMCESVKTL